MTKMPQPPAMAAPNPKPIPLKDLKKAYEKPATVVAAVTDDDEFEDMVNDLPV